MTATDGSDPDTRHAVGPVSFPRLCAVRMAVGSTTDAAVAAVAAVVRAVRCRMMMTMAEGMLLWRTDRYVVSVDCVDVGGCGCVVEIRI